jgi:hypothetical protein
MNARKPWVVFFLLLALSACDHGLEPPPATKPGFGGRITYVGNWPPADSIYLLAVVAFKTFPPTNILADILSGNAVYDTSLSRNVEFQDYQILTDPATFQYIVVAQQYGPDIFSQWRVIGTYSDNPSQGTPKSVVVSPETFVTSIDITVDFDHPPPQFFTKPISP